MRGFVVAAVILSARLWASCPDDTISLTLAPEPGTVIMRHVEGAEGLSTLNEVVVTWKGQSRGFIPVYNPHPIYIDTTCMLEAETLTVRWCGDKTTSIAVPPPNIQPTIRAETVAPWFEYVNAYFTMPNSFGQRRIRAWLLTKSLLLLDTSMGGTEDNGSAQAGAPGETGPVLFKAIACGAKSATDTALLGGPYECDKGCPTPDCAGDPVNTASLNMRYEDSDPLPGYALHRVYDSRTNEVGFFGTRWFSVFDARLSMFDDFDGLRYVTVWGPDREWFLFEGSGNAFTQIGPGRRRDSTLQPLPDGAWRHTLPGGREVRDFNASGRIVAVRDVRTGRETRVVWNADLPVRLEDSWGNWTLTITTDPLTRRITQIAPSDRPDQAWTYTHDAHHLLRIQSPLGTWRTYEHAMPGGYPYERYRLVVARDGAGNVIETHDYHDDSGRARTSVGGNGEIDYINYSEGRQAGEVTMNIRYKNGRTERHYKRIVAAEWRTVEVSNVCSSCNQQYRAFAFDAWGNVTRAQSADGYITSTTWDGPLGRKLTTTEAQRPETCDPATAADQCRLTTDALTEAVVVPTPYTRRTWFAYEDSNWPDVVTRTRTASVHAPGEFREERVILDPPSGQETARTLSGFTGIPARLETRTTTTTLYDGTEGAAFAPGGAFLTTWSSRPQPRRAKVVNGPRTDVADHTTFVYYPIATDVPAGWRGQLAAVRNALGHITRYEDYDAFGNARRVIDANNVVTEASFDLVGRRTTMTTRGIAGCDTAADSLCATDLTATWTYPNTGPETTSRQPGIGITTQTFDERGRLHTVARGPSPTDLQEQLETTYDPLTGKKALERYLTREYGNWGERRRVGYLYDADENLSAITYPDAASVGYRYDSGGRLTAQRDENATTDNTFYAYDPAGRLREVKQRLGAGFITTSYTYDAHDNLKTVTDPNANVTLYTYDDFGQLLRQESPVSGTTGYAYDLGGNLVHLTDSRGAVATRTYDVLGRLATSSTRLGVAVEATSWSYDQGTFGVGRLTAMADATGTTTYLYDRRGLLIQERKALPDVTYTITFGYDADGNRSRITYPSGRAVTFGHDYAGRPTSATTSSVTLVSATSYLPFGPQSSITYGNGTSAIMTYDARYRPMTRTLTGPGGTIASHEYGHDKAGNITGIDDLQDPTWDRSFAYDDLHRLKTATTGSSLWGTGGYAYDAMGNMTSRQTGPHAASFVYQGNTPRIQAVTEDGVTHPVLYDQAGNETQARGTTFDYSPRNMLARAGEWLFDYDARGLRTTARFSAPPIAAIAVSPQTVVAGSPATGSVTLTSPAPDGGATVSLAASTDDVSLPETVQIPAGAVAATFPVTTQTSPLDRSVTLRASYGMEAFTTLTVRNSCPVQLGAIELSQTTVIGGGTVQATILLREPANGTQTIALASSNALVASVPSTVTAPAGATSTTFTIDTHTVAMTGTVTLTAGSCSPVTATLTVTPVPGVSLVITPSRIVGGGSTTAVATTVSPAPAGGTPVALASSDVSVATVPASVTVPAGSNTASAPVTTFTRATDTSALITATVESSSSAAVLEVVRCGAAPSPPALDTGEILWWDDAPPAGATLFGDWNWDSTIYATGIRSLVDRTIAGGHEQWFDGTSSPMSVLTSDRLFVYAMPDPCNPPREIMLGWHVGSWPRAYWGEDLFPYGPRVRVGDLPPTGRWTRLEVPAWVAGIGDQTVTGMALSVQAGRVWFDRAGKRPCDLTAPAPSLTFPENETVWFDDAPPAGAQLNGLWQWDTTVRASGTQSHGQPPAVGGVEHWFIGATNAISTGPQDELFVYVYVDPCNPPREIMIGWHGDQWPRAYWGEDLFPHGPRVRMGDVPAAGGWTRLTVPAATLSLSGRMIDGMAFSVWGGRAWFDRAGVISCGFPPPATPALGAGDTVWVDDAPPQGASVAGSWSWDTVQRAGGSQSMANPAWNGPQEFWFYGATPVPLAANDKLFVYVLVDPCAPPREIMLGFNSGGWPRFYWGEDLFPHGPKTRVGDVPSGGQWVRLEVPASAVGASVTGIAFSVWSGRAWFDLAGVSSTGSGAFVPMTSSVATNTEPELRRHSLYTPELNLLAETALTSAALPAIAHEYVWFGGQPLAQVETATGAMHWYFNDHLGAPLLTTDSAGTVDWRVERDPYGTIVSTRAGTLRHQPLGLPGQEDVGVRDLAYNIFRWYRSAWGRYTQADPLDHTTPGVLNAYDYSRSNPIRFIDQDGRETRTFDDYVNCFRDPYGCGVAKACAEKALAATIARFGFDENNAEPNAYKHCYLNCCMTKSLGAARTKRWTDGHENYPKNPRCEKEMDSHNNEQGRQVSGGTSCDAHCGTASLQKTPRGSCKPCGVRDWPW